MLTFAICPHDAEEGLEKWEKYALKLSQYLQEEVVLTSFKDFEEEEKLLGKLQIQLYYARPKIALMLKHHGYVPVAKLKKAREGFVLIKRKGAELKKPLEVSIISSPFLLMSLIKHFGSLNELNLIYRGSFEHIVEDVVNGIAYLGVVYKDFWERVKDKYKDSVEVEDEIYYPNLHLLMAKKEVADRLKTIAEIIPDFEKATEEDLEFIEDFEKVGAYFLMFRSLHDIAQAILNAPAIGILIYRDRILYANKAVSKITGYTEEELKRMSLLELVDDFQNKEFIRNSIIRLLSSEQFERIYNGLKLKKKDGKVIYTLTFSRTILFNGEYAGFAIILDITKKKRLEQLYNLIKDINQLIIKAVSQREIFKKICNYLVEKLNLPLVWIALVGNRHIKPAEICGKEFSYLEEIRRYLYEEKPSYLANQSVKERKIVINPDTRNNPAVEPWRQEMLKRGFLSSCHIPLERDGKVIAVINLYASEPNFFSEEVKDILEELRRDLNFSLERLVEIRRLTVINKALELAEEWVAVFDELGRIRFTNEAVKELLGYEPNEVILKNLDSFRNPYLTSQRLESLLDRLRRGERVITTLPLRKKDGEYVYLSVKMIPVRLPNEKCLFVMVAKDITLELELTEEIERIKFYDVLTELYNFNGFSFKVQEILAEYDGLATLILIDIYNLSYINHHYGLYMGDEILKETARCLRKHFRSYDIIAKLGGDEFGIFTWKIESKEEITILERKLNKIFEGPMKIGNVEVPVNINAGISVYPDDGKDFKTLYEKANVALKKAKDVGPGEIIFFNEELEKISEKHIKVDMLIEKAIKNNWFVFFYQPYFSLRDIKLAGFEALIRIIDDEGNLYSPKEFIEFLEKSPYLKDFQYWALEEITKISKKWNIPIAFNLYPKTLGDKEFMQALIEKCLKEVALITLEITERAIVENIENVKEIFTFLKNSCHGLYIAVDDFGTGYSAFSYLKELPLDYLKIDISFIRDITKTEKDKALVSAMVQMAHSLGLRTIAEGVETEEQLNILKEIGCDIAQGYYFSKPLPAEEVEKRLKDWVK